MVIQRTEEIEISRSTDLAIRSLLADCFSDFPEGRSFYKQLPDYRWLAWEKDRLIGHLAIDYRMISNNARLFRVFGISDLCVSGEFQGQKVATALLKQMEAFARQKEIDFILLMAAETGFYVKNGFRTVENNCRWMIIHNNRSLGIVDRRIKEGLMIKGLGEAQWEAGSVDFLGHLF